jgi:hypothetical protein
LIYGKRPASAGRFSFCIAIAAQGKSAILQTPLAGFFPNRMLSGFENMLVTKGERESGQNGCSPATELMDRMCIRSKLFLGRRENAFNQRVFAH